MTYPLVGFSDLEESDEVNLAYLEWMYHIVCDDEYSSNLAHRKLFAYLYDTEFKYTISMDSNRAADGVELRYRFGRDHGYSDDTVKAYLDDRPCSVLEMMIALALRCETHIMDDPDCGNRVGQWFWDMIVNLGLGSMTDERFDEDYVAERIDIFLNRKYDRNGRGGLFTVEDPPNDMRITDIWYQMCWYLNDLIDVRI